jgi:hypothetical protein
MIRFTKKAIVNADADKVWGIFAHGFNDAYKWMASVNHSFANTNGASFEGCQSDGRVCELSPDGKGIKASEQFLAYNEENKTATIKIDFLNTPAIFPVKFNTLDFSLKNIGGGKSEMTWKFRSEIRFLAYLIWPLIRIGLGVFVAQIMEELKFYAENDSPHPRKIKALKKQGAMKNIASL